MLDDEDSSVAGGVTVTSALAAEATGTTGDGDGKELAVVGTLEGGVGGTLTVEEHFL